MASESGRSELVKWLVDAAAVKRNAQGSRSIAGRRWPAVRSTGQGILSVQTADAMVCSVRVAETVCVSVGREPGLLD